MSEKAAGQRGGILAMVLLAWLVLVSFAFAAVVLVTRETRTRSSELAEWQATYLAQAGVEKAVAELAQDADRDWSNNPPGLELNGELDTGTYRAVVTPLAKNRALVVSTGSADGKTWRVRAVLAVNWHDPVPTVAVKSWSEPEALRRLGL